jgi:hypothetical protein
VTAVSLAALAALAVQAAPAQAAPARTTAGTTVSAGTTAPAGATAAKVDRATWQKDCQAVMDQALPYLRQRIAAARPGE